MGARAAKPGELEHGQNEESPNKSSPTYSVKDKDKGEHSKNKGISD